jgi:selenocysteine lyase/cysteine desulfurase
MDSIQERALGLNRYLTKRLAEAGWRVLSPLEHEAARSAETLVEAAYPERVVAQLAGRGVIVTKKPQGIRVSTDFFNNENDVDQLMEALASIRLVSERSL